MIWFWRVLVIFCVMNLANIIAVDGGAGTEIVWSAILIGSLLLSIKKIYKFLFGKKWFKITVILCISVFVAVEALIIGNGVLSYNKKDADYVIVLGARVRGDAISLELRNRLNTAKEYLDDNIETKVIVTGGQGPGENTTEAYAMAEYLKGEGIDDERIILEEDAKDTEQNLENSFEIINNLEENPLEQEIVVVTSNFHTLRAKMIASDLGRSVGTIGSPTLLFLIPSYYLREFFAVVVEAIL